MDEMWTKYEAEHEEKVAIHTNEHELTQLTIIFSPQLS